MVPTGKDEPMAWSVVNVALQLSLAVGAVQVTVLLQPEVTLCVMLLGIPEIVGLILSVIVTVNDPVAVLPEASVTVYVTVVVPTGKKLPGALVVVSVKVQLSLAVGAVQLTFAPHEPAVTFWVILEGTPVKVGLILSTMVTVKELVVTLPEASVAV